MDETAVLGFAASLGNKIAAVSEEVEELKETLVNPMLEKGRVDTVADLANIEDPQPGWVYLVGLVSDENKSEYMYTASGTWEYLGSHVTVDAEPTQGSSNAVSSGGVYSLDIPGRLKSIAAAAAYDPSGSYSAGDYMTYDGELYKYDANGTFPSYPNLFDATAAKTGTGYQDGVCYFGTGTQANPLSYISSNIAITAGAAYKLKIYTNWQTTSNVKAAAFFDSNGTEVGTRIAFTTAAAQTVDEISFTAPSTAAYIRLCITKAGESSTELKQAASAKFRKTTLIQELGGVTRVYCTQAEYDLLDPPDPDTEYNIIESSNRSLNVQMNMLRGAAEPEETKDLDILDEEDGDTR